MSKNYNNSGSKKKLHRKNKKSTNVTSNSTHREKQTPYKPKTIDIYQKVKKNDIELISASNNVENTHDEYSDTENEENYVNDKNAQNMDTDIEKKNKIGREKIENDRKIKDKLKCKISEWMDFDDKIKESNNQLKIYKSSKKEHEKLIIDIIEKLELGDLKFDIPDENKNIRGRVYRHKTVSKQAIKEETIKTVLMEVLHDQNKVNQLVKKIDDRRPIRETYRLKRTKGTV